jgi:DNA-binding transcriptional ArsR family regulator
METCKSDQMCGFSRRAASVSMEGMHLLPPERAGRRIIDGDEVCDAIAGLGDPAEVQRWAALFGVLADTGRLSLLLCIHRVPGICVTDLAAATGMNDSTVSQALRLLRAAGLVQDRRDGRIIRYELTDPGHLLDLLRMIRPAVATGGGHQH